MSFYMLWMDCWVNILYWPAIDICLCQCQKGNGVLHRWMQCYSACFKHSQNKSLSEQLVLPYIYIIHQHMSQWITDGSIGCTLAHYCCVAHQGQIAYSLSCFLMVDSLRGRGQLLYRKSIRMQDANCYKYQKQNYGNRCRPRNDSHHKLSRNMQIT